MVFIINLKEIFRLYFWDVTNRKASISLSLSLSLLEWEKYNFTPPWFPNDKVDQTLSQQKSKSSQQSVLTLLVECTYGTRRVCSPSTEILKSLAQLAELTRQLAELLHDQYRQDNPIQLVESNP